MSTPKTPALDFLDSIADAIGPDAHIERVYVDGEEVSANSGGDAAGRGPSPLAEAWALVIGDRTDSVYLSHSMATIVARGHQRDRDDVTVVPLVRAAECDRLLDKVAALTVENTDLKEQRAVFGEDLDRAFLDGYGAAYIKARPGRFVPMTEYADEAADALTEWHKDNGDTVDNACVGCGVNIDEGRTHCGSLECGSGSIER